MATTFTLKRKYFADPEEDQKKSGVGKKLAIGGAIAATAATALAAKGAGGLGKLASGGFKAFGANLKTGAGQTMQQVGKWTSKTAGNAANSAKEGSLLQKGLIKVGKAGKTVTKAGGSVLASVPAA